ncbi:MAG: AraC family transcriptional regulator [Cyanobacteria bacterium J06648_1]
MKNKRAEIKVATSQLPGILIEKYQYSAGSLEPLPKHAHQEYQLGMSFNCQGEYFYRGAYHPVPIGNLSIIHSGEVHSPSERTYLSQPATFWMMHVDPSRLRETALEIADDASVPFFKAPVIADRSLGGLFYGLCLAVQTNTCKLTQDALLLDFFANLIGCRDKFIPESYPRAKSAIARVCEYLQENYTDNVSLAELASIAGTSRFYLSRLFHRQQGITLGAYHTQIKVDRAKKLLAQGMSIAQTASATGFYDQSHLGHHFKRIVGTTPGNYQPKKEQ